MANLTRTNWPAGWLPSSDALNGDPNGLLRMDNLRVDHQGIVSLINGHQVLGASEDYVNNMYSKIISGKEYLWLAYGESTNDIRRSTGITGGVSLLSVGAGSANGPACFGEAFGYTLACAGGLRVKDYVTKPPEPLGILSPNYPPLSFNTPRGMLGSINSQTEITIPCPTKVTSGVGASPQVTLVGTVWFGGVLCTENNFDLDTLTIGDAASLDVGQDTISFPFTVLEKPTDIITRVVLDFLLDGSAGDPSTNSNMYEFVFLKNALQTGPDTKVTLSQQRNQAIRYGTDSKLNWSHVIGVRFTVVATETVTVELGDIRITGGIEGGLHGVYQYIQQDVVDDGNYLAKSPVGFPAWNIADQTHNFNVINGSVSLVPVIADQRVTEHRFFRKSVSDLGVDPNTGESLNTSTLNQWYYVGKSAKGVTFIDYLSDTEIVQLNADGSFLPNLYLKSLNTNDTWNGLHEPIYAIEGLHRERVLYMGAQFIYLSDRLNPDAVDTRFTLRPGGDAKEKNLWLKRLTNDVVMLATNQNLYEVTGTLLDLPDGTVDANLIPVGEAFPPLSADVCKYDNGLYYVAADGLRVTTGSNSVNVSPQLRPLFQNTMLDFVPRTVAVHGVPTVAIHDGTGVSYSIAAAHQRIYFVIPCQDGSRRLVCFDTVTKTYSLLFTDPAKIFATQAGELIASFGGAPPTVWVLDAVPGFGVKGFAVEPQGMPFKLRTVFDANNQPRNRKDTFTLKLILDTGGLEVSVDIQKNGIGVSETDEASWVNLGRVSAAGEQTVYLKLDSSLVTLGFRYALQLSDVSGVFTFKLYEATIEYEPRPEQLNYLRILPTNAGTISRKRWTAYAFVIDTLGNSIQFTPYLDNMAWSAVGTVVTGTKLTYIFYFDSEAIATDMGGVLSGGAGAGGIFEFYSLNLEECVSEKLPAPTTYLVIPANNYGSPNRKRHTSYKFQMLSRGGRVQFTPILDGTAYSQDVFTTISKRTCDYFFTQSEGDVIGVDIGGILESIENPKQPFEFYGVVVPQKLEILPDRLEYFRTPNTNFGVASRKRIRTLPMIIDTRGRNVTFIPIVDGVSLASSSHNTNARITVYHYFVTDVFGTDFGGIFQSSEGNFEFYEFGQPENVEVLPVPKKYDQVSMRFDKIGKIFGFRTRLIMSGSTTQIPYSVWGDDSPSLPTLSVPQYSGSFPVLPGTDNTYEVQFPKNVNTDILRLTLGPTEDAFHRYDVLIKVQSSGMQGQSKWIPIR